MNKTRDEKVEELKQFINILKNPFAKERVSEKQLMAYPEVSHQFALPKCFPYTQVKVGTTIKYGSFARRSKVRHIAVV